MAKRGTQSAKKLRNLESDIEDALRALNQRFSIRKPEVPEIIAEILDKPPHWKLSKAEKKHLCECLQSDLEICQHCLIESGIPVSNSDILTHFCQNLALNGIFYTGKISEVSKLRKQLIDIKFETLFETSKDSTFSVVNSFSSETEQKEFRDSFDTRRYGCFSETTKNAEQQTEQDMYHTAVFAVPLKVWAPVRSDLCISYPALKYLQRLENIFLSGNSEKAKQMCMKFFDLYGSHISMENIELGGSFLIESSYPMGLDMFLEAIAKNNFAVPNLSDNTLDSKLESKQNRPVEVNCTKTVSAGGPEKVSIYPVWLKTLRECRMTWRVIDKGKHDIEKFVGIWHFICNQKKCFKKSERFSEFLSEIWLSHVNEHGYICISDVLEVESDYFRKLLDGIIKMPSKDYLYTNIFHLAIRTETLETMYGRVFLQKMNLKYNVNFQAVIENSMHCDSNGDLNMATHHLWHSLMKLVQTKSCIGHSLLPGVLDWLKRNICNERVFFPTGIHSVEELITTMSSTTLTALSAIIEQNLCPEDCINFTLTNHFQSAMKALLKTWLSEKRHEEFLILLSNLIPFGFDVSSQNFTSSLDFLMLDKFVNALRNTMNAYGKQEKKEKQPWVLLHVTSCIKFFDNCESTTEDDKEKVFFHVMEMLDRAEMKFCTENVRNLVLKSNQSLSSILKGLVKVTGLSLYHFKNMFKMRTTKRVFTSHGSDTFVPESDHGNDFIQAQLRYILDKLGMTVYFPARLKHENVLAMHENQYAKPTSFTELPWAILRRIIAVNYDFREKLLHALLQDLTSEANNGSQENQSKPKKGLIKSRFNKSVSLEDIHPSDVFLALFQCLDPFLKRCVVQKMQMCKVAIPLIYPRFDQNGLIFSLWPLREVFIDTGSESVASKQLRTLAFIRIGDKCKTSKSKLVNQLLRAENDEFKTFFHRNCSLGFQKRKIANGVVEITWLVPDSNAAKSENREFPWPLTVLNLRGDASCFENQLKILMFLSNVMIILIDFDDLMSDYYDPLLRTIHSSEISTIILSNFPDQNAEEVLDKLILKTKLDDDKSGIISTIEGGNDINEIELRDLLVKTIQDCLEETDIGISLEELPDDISDILHCDENEENSVRGKKMAEAICSVIETSNHTIYEKYDKNDILPLQGSLLWHEWSNLQKEYQRCSKKERMDKRDPRTEKMKILRLQQTYMANQNCGTIPKFIEIVIANIDKKEIILYFLSWLRQYMDSNSRLVLPTHREKLKKAILEYETIRSKLKSADVNEDVEKNLEKLRKKISKAEIDLAHASFGLEHFFREMGQIFESFSYSKNDMHCQMEKCTNQVLQNLPMVAAKLLLWGQPLEIMDGDAANVPVKWIGAVFEELSRLVGRSAKIYCISVLGIQSSGKSTLLNTMFGLQFAVSAGRCTRGIFIQLIPIDRKKSSLKFDYALIIDTEGLHAPELASEKRVHDNELATLVIGLGDLTVINIKGEALADMEDVLQIVVHALIRLKQANDKLVLNQSCIFVHQNVSSQDLENLTLHGNQKIIEKLDEMTKEVAKEEHLADIKSFKDVIEFNSTSDINYLSDCPGSREYSFGVMKMTENLLTNLKKRDQKAFLSIGNTGVHLLSLWKGILSENFVFSFRNVIEVKAYSLLERKFQQLTWQLEELKLKWLNDRVRPTLRQCKTYDELERNLQSILEQFTTNVASKTKAIAAELESFFNASDLAEYMVHWRGRKQAELQSIAAFIIADVKQKLYSERTRCWTLLESSNRLLKNKEELHKKATEFAKSLKGCRKGPSEKDILKEFGHAWKIWVREIIDNNPEQSLSTKIRQMKAEILAEIFERFKHHESLLTNDIEGSLEKWENDVQLEDSLSAKDINKKDISIYSIKVRFMDFFSETCKKQTKRVIDTIFFKIDSYLKQHERDIEYDVSIFKKVLNFVTQDFEKYNAELNNQYGFSMTYPLKVKVAVHVSTYSFWYFSKMIEAYEEKHCLRSRIEASRDEVCALFVGMCTEKANEIIVANVFCVEMKPLIIEKVERELSMYIPKVINEHFEYRKYPLIKCLLQDLAEREDFKNYLKYIQSSETYATSWITNYAQCVFAKVINGQKSRYIDFVEECIENIIKAIIQSAENASSNPHILKAVGDWVIQFRSEIRKLHLSFSKVPFQSVLELKVNNFDNLVENIKEQVIEMKNEVTDRFFSKGMTKIVWKEPSPYTTIIQKLWGCPEACPWCREPCATASREDQHTHHCIQHRPGGVGGIHTKDGSEIVLESCNYAVQTSGRIRCGRWCNCRIKDDSKYHPYKDYKRYIPSWDITPSSDTSEYWSWFMAKYSKDLVEAYSLQPREIPDEWYEITKEDALLSLSKYE